MQLSLNLIFVYEIKAKRNACMSDELKKLLLQCAPFGLSYQ
jgi:hypothetical protein